MAARRTPTDQTLAKEGTSAVGSARPFPSDDATAKPPADRGCRLAREPAPAWPILARIAEIAESRPSTAPSESPSYRVDSPHAAAPPIHTSPTTRPLQRSGASPTHADTTDATEYQDRVLAFAPLPIRLTVQAWRLMQPYLGIIRFAAMLALMAIGGTSMTLMLGGFWHHADPPPNSSTTAVDQTSTLEAAPSAIEPMLPLDPPTPPDAKSSSIAPTAIGPTAAKSKPLMAIESTEAPSAGLTENSTETSTPLAVASSSAQNAEIPVSPATPFAASTSPQSPSEPWPQVQTSEPAVARLSGVVLETESR